MSATLFVPGVNLKREKKQIDLNKNLLNYGINKMNNTLDIFPKIYYHGKTRWPNKTKNPCFRCDCQMLYRKPVFIPNGMYFDEETGEIGYIVGTVVCSFECGYTQLYQDKIFMTQDEFCEKLIMLKNLYKDYHNKEIKKFTFAPDKRRRKKNGGELIDKEYQELIKF